MSRIARLFVLAAGLTIAARAPALEIASDLFSSGGGSASSGGLRLAASAIGQGIGGGGLSSANFALAQGAQIAGGAGLDADADGLSDATESVIGTNIHGVDTDADGLSDFDEVSRDGDPNDYQVGVDTDPLDADTDNDGIVDGLDRYPLGAPVPALPGSSLPALVLLLACAGAVALRRSTAVLR